MKKKNTRTKNVTDGPTYGPRQLGIELRVVDLKKIMRKRKREVK